MSAFAFANDNQALMNRTYDLAYKNASVNCEYYYWRDVPKIVTVSQKTNRAEGHALGKFAVNGKTIDVLIKNGGSNGIVDFRVDGVQFQGSLKNRGTANEINHIQLNLTGLNPEQTAMSQAVQLNDMDCSVEIGMENHHKLTQERVHINMHPHQNYDFDGESIPGIKRELSKSSQQLMLLDDSTNNKFKALGTNFNSFIQNGVWGLSTPPMTPPAFEIPRDIPLKLSQAGHNRFTLMLPNYEITYSGGNHNFCILNNTRRVMHGFMENPKAQSITFKYPLDAIVVQRSTWLKGGDFSRSDLKYSNMLSKVFPQMGNKKVTKYLNAYFDYFKWNYFPEKKFFFATVTFRQVLKGGYERVETIQGEGEGHIDVTFEYL